jgi:hypothetical protein
MARTVRLRAEQIGNKALQSRLNYLAALNLGALEETDHTPTAQYGNQLVRLSE